MDVLIYKWVVWLRLDSNIESKSLNNTHLNIIKIFFFNFLWAFVVTLNLVFVLHCRHHIETRQIQYHFLVCGTLVAATTANDQQHQPSDKHHYNSVLTIRFSSSLHTRSTLKTNSNPKISPWSNKKLRDAPGIHSTLEYSSLHQ